MAAATRDTTPDAPGGAAEVPPAGLSRAGVWTGMALGTALAILAITNGALLRVGGTPPWLGVILGAVIVWALIQFTGLRFWHAVLVFGAGFYLATTTAGAQLSDLASRILAALGH